jgi:hypothetical protein
MKVSNDFVREALETRYYQVKDQWSNEAIDQHIDEIIDNMVDIGIPSDPKYTPMYIIDNMLVNGEHGYISNFLLPEEDEEQAIARIEEEGDYVFLWEDKNDIERTYVVFSL